MTTLTLHCGPGRNVGAVRAKVETVSVDGLPVRLRTLAPAGRLHDALVPTVLLVHGIGMSHRSFARSQQALARTHRTVAVDLPASAGCHRPVDGSTPRNWPTSRCARPAPAVPVNWSSSGSRWGRRSPSRPRAATRTR